MERIAIIDLGSNSIRFIIMQIGEHGAYKLIYQEKKSIRLAEGMTLTSRLLTEEAQQRAVFLVFPILALLIGQFTGILLISAGLLWGVGAVLAALDVLLMRGAAGTFTYEKLLR